MTTESVKIHRVPLLDFQGLYLLFAIVTMIIVFPWFAIAIAVLAVVFVVLYVFFRSAMREFKRLENVTRYCARSLQGVLVTFDLS